MKPLLIVLLGITPLSAQNNGTDQPSDFVTPPSGGKFLRWYGKLERTYFVQVSSDAEPLQKWSWAPVIETGNNQDISHQVFSSAPRGFFRLKYTDDPIPAGKTPDTTDFDRDELENYAEITGTPQTDPLNADTDGDSLPDGWEKAHGLNGNDATDAANLFPGSNLTNQQAYNAGVQANANATPTDKDGDDADDNEDADPDDKYVDWEPAAEASYVVIELEKEAYGEPLPNSIETKCRRSASIGNGGLVLYDVYTSHKEPDGENFNYTYTRSSRVWKDGTWSIDLVDQITPRTDHLGNRHDFDFPTVCGEYVIGNVYYHNDSPTYDPKTGGTRWNLESENPTTTRIYDQQDVGGANTDSYDYEGFYWPVTSPGGAMALASGSNFHPEIAKWRIWVPPTNSTSSSYVPGSGPSTAQIPYVFQPYIDSQVLAIEDQGAMVVWSGVEMEISDGGTKYAMPNNAGYAGYHCMSRVSKGYDGDSRIVVGATHAVDGPNGPDYENGSSCLWIKKGSKVNAAQRTPTIGWVRGIANNGVILGKHSIWRNGKAVTLDSFVESQKVDGPTSATRYTNLEGLAINGHGAIVATADDQLNQGEGHKTLILLAPVELKRDEEGNGENWATISGDMAKALPGQRINLKPDFQSFPSGVAPSNYSWSINGMHFTSYYATNEKGQKSNLNEVDLTNERIRFYWSDPGIHEVTLSFLINGVTRSVSNRVKIIKPESRLNANIGQVSFSGLKDVELSGTIAGILFQAKVESVAAEFRSEGRWHFVQVLNSREKVITNADTFRFGNNYGKWVVDSTYPYAQGASTGENSLCDDSPISTMDNAYRRWITQDDFKMYLMFKPPGINTEWVPLKRIDWLWDWKTTKTDGIWSLDSGAKAEVLNDGVGVDDYIHPEWDGNYKPFSWNP